MFKALASSLLIAAVQSNSKVVGVPPHSHMCKTESNTLAPWGLKRDYDMGGCKCADDTAEWGPGNNVKEEWKCWCTIPDTYEAMPEDDAKASATRENNNRACGVINTCQNAAVLQQKTMWASEIARLKKERTQTTRLNKK